MAARRRSPALHESVKRLTGNHNRALFASIFIQPFIASCVSLVSSVAKEVACFQAPYGEMGLVIRANFPSEDRLNFWWLSRRKKCRLCSVIKSALPADGLRLLVKPYL